MTKCAYCSAPVAASTCPGCGRDVMILGPLSPWKEFHRRMFALMEHKYPGVAGCLCIQTDTWDGVEAWHGPTHTIRCWVGWQDTEATLQENLLQEYLDPSEVSPEWAVATALRLMEVHYAHGGLAFVTRDSLSPIPARAAK